MIAEAAAPSTHHPLATLLPRLDPGEAATRTALIAALHGRTAEALMLTTRATDPGEQAVATWIGFATKIGPVAIAPLVADGLVAAMNAGVGRPDAIAAATTLGRIEPLVAALERVLGVELHPSHLSDDLAVLLPGDAAPVTIDAATNGILRHRLLLAIPPGTPLQPLPSPARTGQPIGLPAGIRLRWRGIVAGPVVMLSQLQALGCGDLLLLGAGRLKVRLVMPAGYRNRVGEPDLAAGIVRITDDISGGERAMDSGTDDRFADGAEAAAADDSLRLATTIEFDGGDIGIGDISGLNAGSVLPLPGRGGTLPVRVLAGGARIADGELVAVGDGYGVLVTRVATASPAV